MHASHFIADVASRLANRVQLTTDGHKPHPEAPEAGFGGAIDYAMLVEIYGSPPGDEIRRSPAECVGTKKLLVSGSPDPTHVSTSVAERPDLTMRMRMSDSLGSRMLSARRSRTTNIPSLATRRTTTSSAGIGRFAPPRRRRRA
jgi:hypothetical protein